MNQTELETELAQHESRASELRDLHQAAANEAAKLDASVKLGDFAKAHEAATESAKRDAISRALESIQADIAATQRRIAERDAAAAKEREAERIRGLIRQCVALDVEAQKLAEKAASDLAQTVAAIFEARVAANRFRGEIGASGQHVGEPALFSKEFLQRAAPVAISGVSILFTHLVSANAQKELNRDREAFQTRQAEADKAFEAKAAAKAEERRLEGELRLERFDALRAQIAEASKVKIG